MKKVTFLSGNGKTLPSPQSSTSRGSCDRNPGRVMLQHGVPKHVRSDNGAEITARRVRTWFPAVGTQPLLIEPGSPWENGYCESCNGKFADRFTMRRKPSPLRRVSIHHAGSW